MDKSQKSELPELVIKSVVLWRAHVNLNRGGRRIAKRGDVCEFASLSNESKKALEEQGAISRVSGPPIKALPGWKTRGAKLKKLGIETVEQLLGADDKALGLRLARGPKTIARWKVEAKDWLLAPVYSG